jgi:hypothetical protein
MKYSANETSCFNLDRAPPFVSPFVRHRTDAECKASAMVAAPHQRFNVPLCAICGKPCPLEDCKVSFDGRPVHDECIVAKLTKKSHQPKLSTESLRF